MVKRMRKSGMVAGIGFLVAAVILLGIRTINVSAQTDETFEELITRLYREDSIPVSNGTFLDLGNYEDTYSNMGYYRLIPLLEAGHFVLSLDLSWTSANNTPNTSTSGCGVMFNSGSDSSNIMTFSLLMDGSAYLYGKKDNKPLYYGKKFYTLPAVNGEAHLMMVVNEDKTDIYIDGEPIYQKTGLPVLGKSFGFMILSGTYQGFGTRCTHDNIHLYTWE